MTIRAVFFDAVGTLIHPDPAAAVIYAEVAQRFGSRLTVPEIASRFRTAFNRQELIDRASGWRTSEAREIERWRQIVAEVLADVSEPAECFAELYAHFGRPEAWRREADIEPTLFELARRGYTLGLASNYDSRLRPVAAALLPRLRHILISSAVGWRKPAPEFFAALARLVELPAEEILYVGDDLANDYQGARAAGLDALLFDPLGKQMDQSVRRISRLMEAAY